MIYNVCDPDEQKQLPQHNFNITQSDSHFLPLCFEKHIQTIQGKHELSDQDQSLVIIRPNITLGVAVACGPQITCAYAMKSPNSFSRIHRTINGLSKEMQKLAIRSHDAVYYFTDLTIEEDIMLVTTEKGCKHYCYEQEKLIWFQNQISNITIQYQEAVHLLSEQEIGSKSLENLYNLISNHNYGCNALVIRNLYPTLTDLAQVPPV